MTDAIQKYGLSLDKAKESSWRSQGKKLMNKFSQGSPKAQQVEAQPPPQSYVPTTPQHHGVEDEPRSYRIADQFTASHTKQDLTARPSSNVPSSNLPNAESQPRYNPSPQVQVTDRLEPAHHKDTIATDSIDRNAQAQSPPHIPVSQLSLDEEDTSLQDLEYEFAGDAWCKTAEVENNEVLPESHTTEIDWHGPVSELQGNETISNSEPVEISSQPVIAEAPESHPTADGAVTEPESFHELSASPRPPQSIIMAYGGHAHRNGATSRQYKAYEPNESNSPSITAEQAARAAFENSKALNQHPAQQEPSTAPPKRVPVRSQPQPQHPPQHQSQHQSTQRHQGHSQHELQHQPQPQPPLQQIYSQHQPQEQTHRSYHQQDQQQSQHSVQVTSHIRNNVPVARAQTSMLDVGDEAESSEETEESPILNNRNSHYYSFEPRAEDSRYQPYAPENSKRGFLQTLRKSKGSSKKSTHIRKSQPSESRSSHGDLARFIKDYKIPKREYEDSLSALLNWAEQMTKAVEEKDQSLQKKNRKITELKAELSSYEQVKAERDSLEDHVTRITADLDKTRDDLTRVRAQRNDARDHISTLVQEAQDREQHHKRQFMALKEAAAVEQSKLLNAHKEEVRNLELHHQTLLDTHREELENLNLQHQTAVNSQNTVIQNFRRRIANYTVTANHEVISDDELRDTFQGLSRRINNLIQWVPRPESFQADPSLDPSQFLTRNAQQGGRNWPKFIRNLCWRTILRGFFSHELGFGVFGASGKGYDFLNNFRRPFAIPDPQHPSGTATTLPNTKEMNGWRAALFNVFLKAVRNGDSNDEYVGPFRDNVDAVTDELVDLLQRAAGNGIDPRIRDEVHEVVEGLGVLALEAGAQRAQICLEGCDYGEVVTVGERFRDEDMMAQGSLTVDLMTQPCMRRVGDGREDLTMQRVIVKGDFVPLKTGY